MHFKSNSFYTVVSNSTFEHIRYDLLAVKEVYRVLKKEGHFIFTTTTERFKKTVRNFCKSDKKFSLYNKRVQHYHYKSIKEWINLLKEVGFKNIYIRDYANDRWMKSWWLLFRLTTLKVYKRELWSYLKDSPYSRIFPSKLIGLMYYYVFYKEYRNAFFRPDNWVFIMCEK